MPQPTSAPRARIAMVVVSYGSEPLIAALLPGLAGGLHSGALEVVVVTNSGDCSGLARHPGVTVLDPGRNLGFARACAMGAAHARAERILFCNPDVTIDWRVAQVLDTLLDAHREYAVVAPITGSAVIECAPNGRLLDEERLRFGSVFLIRRSALDEVGGWDGSFFLWWEDKDLQTRLEQRGHRLGFACDVVVPHRGGHSTSGGSPARNRLLTRIWIASKCFYLIKHRGKLAAIAYCVGGLATNLWRILSGRHASRDYHRPSSAAGFFLYLLANCWRLRNQVEFDGSGFPWHRDLAESQRSP